MDEFRIAGSTGDESDERILSQVVRIAGYTSNIRNLIDESFTICKIHGIRVPRVPDGQGDHEECRAQVRRSGPRPRGGPPQTRPL